MRAGWFGNPELQKRVQRDDPSAHPIVQAIRQVAADIKDRADDWPTGSGWDVLDSGGIRLSGSATTHADTPDQTATDNIITDLDNGSPFEVVEVAWRGTNNTDLPIRQVTVAVDPDVDGGGSHADHFRAKLFRVSREFVDGVEIQPISTHAQATTSGSSAQEITFTFTGPDGRAPTPGAPPIVEDETSPTNVGVPKTWVLLWAVSSDGSAAGNAAWVGDSTSDGSETSATGTHDLRHVKATAMDSSGPLSLGLGARYSLGQPSGMPRLTLQGVTLSAKTVTLSGTEKVDLGAAPEADTALEVVTQGDTFSDSSVTYEISDDSGASWSTVADGDVIGEDNTSDGGNDLSAVSRQQTYQMRTTLTPDSTGTVSPIVRRLGVRELEVTETYELATVDSLSYSIDPLTLTGSIPEAKISLAKNGITDYRDLATELFSTTDLSDIELRVFIGHRELDRQHWLHLDTFLVDDYDSRLDRLAVIGLHPMVKLRTTLPPYDKDKQERPSLQYPGTVASPTLKAVYEDLLTAQVGLLDRRIGAVVEDASTTVSKHIEDSDAKAELDAIARLAGGSVIGSQGKVKYTEVTGADTSVVSAAFPRQEIKVTRATPGFRARVPEFYVPFGFSRSARDYISEVRSFHLPSLISVGTANLDPPEKMDDTVARWIPNDGTKEDPASQLAETVGDRLTQEVGVGIAQLSFTSAVPYPYLEVGDLVAVQTDRMVLRDPNTGTDIRGILWAVGTIIGTKGAMGRRFTVWVRDYADTVPAVEGVGVPDPERGFVNLLGAGAGPEHSGTGGFYEYLSGEGATADSTKLTTLGLDVGHRLSAGVWVKSDTGADRVRAVLQYLKSDGTTIRNDSLSNAASATYVRLTVEDVEIPATTDSLRLFVQNLDDTETGFSRRAMLNLGPALHPFAPGGTEDLVADVNTPSIAFQDDGSVVVSVAGDTDVAKIYLTVGTGSSPADPDGAGNEDATISGRSGTVDTGVDVTNGTDVYVKARGENHGGALAPASTVKEARSRFNTVNAKIESLGARVLDDGTDDTYEVDWTVNDAVTDAAHEMLVDYYDGPNLQTTATVSDPATTTSDSHVQSGAGGDPGSNHKIRLRLQDTAGNTLDIRESAVTSADTSGGGGGPPIEPQ